MPCLAGSSVDVPDGRVISRVITGQMGIAVESRPRSVWRCLRSLSLGSSLAQAAIVNC
jgi:hypothetical protein